MTKSNVGGVLDLAALAKLHRPAMPEGVTDRAADVWEPLLAIADLAGEPWPERARVAAVTLVTDAMVASPSLGIRLLSDLRTVFGERETMATVDIIGLLTTLDEAPWGDLKGKPLDARRLANLLRQYDVQRTTFREGASTVKGYRRVDLHDAWQRYLGPATKEPVTAVTPVTSASNGHCSRCSGEGCPWCEGQP
jgi:Protein of unknown function (DUF3631)